MSCETCKKTECKPAEGKGLSVPFAVHESAMAQNERTVKRLVIAIVLMALLWFATIGIGVYARMQYDYTNEESVVDVDANDGVANYIGNDDDIVNGADYGN